MIIRCQTLNRIVCNHITAHYFQASISVEPSGCDIPLGICFEEWYPSANYKQSAGLKISPVLAYLIHYGYFRYMSAHTDQQNTDKKTNTFAIVPKEGMMYTTSIQRRSICYTATLRGMWVMPLFLTYFPSTRLCKAIKLLLCCKWCAFAKKWQFSNDFPILLIL